MQERRAAMPSPPTYRASPTQEARKTMWVPKRRVQARVQLADRSTLEGGLYADAHPLDRTPARVLDRLADPTEAYIPLASGDRHILLRKAGIVSVQLDQQDMGIPVAPGSRRIQVRIALRSGTVIESYLRALLPTHARALDYLNRIGGSLPLS